MHEGNAQPVIVTYSNVRADLFSFVLLILLFLIPLISFTFNYGVY